MLATVFMEQMTVGVALAEASVGARMSELGDLALMAGSLGAMYAFIALGYTMVYGIIKLINFAHGEFFMMGAFAAVWALTDFGIAYALGFPAGTVAHYAIAFLFAGMAAGVIAVLTERVAYRPLRGGRAPFTSAFVLMGLGLFLLVVNLPIHNRFVIDITTTPVEQKLLGSLALLFGLLILIGRSGLHLSRLLVRNRDPATPSEPNTLGGAFRDWALKPPKTRLPAGRLAALLTAVGVSLFLQNFGVQLFQAQSIPVPRPKQYHEIEAFEPDMRVDGSVSAEVRSLRYRVRTADLAPLLAEFLEQQAETWDPATAPMLDPPARTLRSVLARREGVSPGELDFAAAVREALEREVRDQAPTGAMYLAPADVASTVDVLLMEYETRLPDHGEFLAYAREAAEAGRFSLPEFYSRPRSATLLSVPRAQRDEDGTYALREADVETLREEYEHRRSQALLAAIQPDAPRSARLLFSLTPPPMPEEEDEEIPTVLREREVLAVYEAETAQWRIGELTDGELSEAEREALLELARRIGAESQVTGAVSDRLIAGARATTLYTSQVNALTRDTAFTLRRLGLHISGREDNADEAPPRLELALESAGSVSWPDTEQPLDVAINGVLNVEAREGWPIEVREVGPIFTWVPVSRTFERVLILVLLAVSMLVLYFLVNHTRPGKAMRAVSYDREAAKLMGINSDKVIQFTFFVGAFLAGMAGLYYGYVDRVEPMMGFFPGLKAFIAAVVGGIGSIPGAVAGGFLLAFIEVGVGSAGRIAQLITGLPSDHPVIEFLGELRGLRDAIVFALLIMILVFKPEGLFGKAEGEKV